MGAAIRWRLQGATHDVCLHSRGHNAPPAALMPRVEPLYAVPLEALAPARDGRRTGVQLALNRVIAQAIGQGQNQTGSEYIAGRQATRLRPAYEFFSFVIGENEQVAISSNAHWTYDNYLRYEWDIPLAKQGRPPASGGVAVEV